MKNLDKKESFIDGMGNMIKLTQQKFSELINWRNDSNEDNEILNKS